MSKRNKPKSEIDAFKDFVGKKVEFRLVKGFPSQRVATLIAVEKVGLTDWLFFEFEDGSRMMARASVIRWMQVCKD
ncbi:MAG: hypothetical protein QXP16_03880 [Candidatus Bathyarchaeia archaeon]